MEPMTIGLVAIGAYVLSRLAGRKNASSSSVETASNFAPFPPDQQGQGWYAACSLQWSEIAPQRDARGRIARVYRGTAAGEAASNRMTNDIAFRAMMGDGYRIAVSESVLYGGGVPTLIAFEDGFSAASLPAELGTLRLLYAPAQGSLGQPPGPNPGPIFNGSVDPGGLAAFEELPEPARSQARELYQSDTASLYELAKTADELDKAGYHASATALRKRRDALLLSRGIEANKRGGWLYIVRTGDLPFNVAQYYGGKKPGVLKEMATLNPDVAKGGTWKGWIGGCEVLLPATWPDPALKPLPPLASGGGGGGGQNAPLPGGTPPGGFSSVMTPWGLYSTNAPLPPGTTATPSPAGGQEAFPVPPGSTAPQGFIWGPPWMGKWSPPQPGGIDPNKEKHWYDFAGQNQSQSPADFGQTTDVGITPASFARN